MYHDHQLLSTMTIIFRQQAAGGGERKITSGSHPRTSHSHLLTTPHHYFDSHDAEAFSVQKTATNNKTKAHY
jgi:hypothetical protein